VDVMRDRLLRKGDYIYGSFCKPESVDGYINGVNPGDRADVLGRFPFSESSVDEAVDFAGIGVRTWRRVAIADRAATVRRFRDHLLRFLEPTARLVTRETGKPLWEARQEIQAAVRSIDFLLEAAPALLEPQVLDNISARSDLLPRGVVGVLCPYNFPILIPTTHTVAAILAGNAVVVKPSKFTPGVGQALASLWDRCRLPRGIYNMVQGPGSVVGQRLVTHPNLDALLFSGSYNTATAISRLTSTRVELPVLAQTGGKGIAIVLDDADLDRAAYEVIVGAFLTAGQRHNSTGRVLVTDAIFDRFTELLVTRSSKLKIGYGTEQDVFMGPLISENLRTRYRRFCRKLTGQGHQALLEPGHVSPDSRRGFYAKPAIYRVHWDNGNPMLDTEPPGPALLVYRVSHWEEASALHNQAMFRGATSLFTQPTNPVIYEMQDRLRTGTLNINRGTIGSSVRLSAAGLGRSSNGHPSGIGILRFLTYPRSQLIEDRPLLEAQTALPGLHWEMSPSAMSPDAPTETPVEQIDDDLVDVSSSLELTQ
jgi:succinylglutamic semialdehyde dehydrogenase